MPISHDFEYFKPLNIEDALKLLDENPENSKILAGGTDLTVLSETAIAEHFEGSRTPSAVKNRLWRLRQEGARGL